MKLADTLERLPEAWKEWLRMHPDVAPLLAEGRTLADALGSADWARRWAAAAEPLAKRLLLRIVRSYAGLPFGEEEAEQRFRRESGWTGAEIRVALLGLRRDGVLYAVRKAWGERLLYVPSDMAGLWQLILLQEQRQLSDPEARDGEGEREVLADAGMLSSASAGLPLSLELLRAWAELRRQALPLTARGAPNKQRVARLTALVGIPAGELDGFWLAEGDAATPANVALVLDLGLALGWLAREQGRIAAAEAPPAGWPKLTPTEADAALLDCVTSRYAGQEARLHWAATALRALKPRVWHLEREAQLLLAEPDPAEREAFGRWLGLLAACGWLERGANGAGEAMLRWRIDPSLPALRRAEAIGEGEEEGGVLFVQPDLEIIVPPEAGLGVRGELERFADRVSLDTVSTYRLTREACVRAAEAGYTEAALAGWLERHSEVPLPASARRALTDWFGRLGRVSLEDVKLLRAEDSELADRLARDPQLSGWLLERIGDRAFAVKPEAARELERRLRELGYPPSGAVSGSSSDDASPRSAAPTVASPPSVSADGWLRIRHPAALYEPDGSLPEPEELFPGIAAVPSAWLRQPRAYHRSTRRELVEKALAWRTGLRVKRGGDWLGFVPEALRATDRGWSVSGTLRQTGPGAEGSAVAASERIELSADSMAEVMIELPDGGGDIWRTNR